MLAGHRAIQSDSESDLKASGIVSNAIPILTYLANLIQAGDRSTPYSMVTAAGSPYTPADLRDDEIVVNDWLAEDLACQPGDQVQLTYYLADAGSTLTERTNTFRVHSVVPMTGLYADRTLMPEFPGLAKAESTHDWEAGFPLVHEIRAKDEAYWKAYRGTPKAFITLAAGQAMWTNRFGSLTAIRYPVPTNSFASVYQPVVYRNILANLDPSAVGLRYDPVREQALAASNQAQDFGGLFLGFSFFLIVAALLLMAMLFQFGIEQRVTEIGTLLALGFTPKQVRRLLLGEGIGLAIFGGVLGALGGIGSARATLQGLGTVWRNAVGTS
ncbi:MAG: ABC transporter permease, partial [Pedosphaera parvula]|nr:ABC transporter permease [Pedosphaera parvula]